MHISGENSSILHRASLLARPLIILKKKSSTDGVSYMTEWMQIAELAALFLKEKVRDGVEEWMHPSIHQAIKNPSSSMISLRCAALRSFFMLTSSSTLFFWWNHIQYCTAHTATATNRKQTTVHPVLLTVEEHKDKYNVGHLATGFYRICFGTYNTSLKKRQSTSIFCL